MFCGKVDWAATGAMLSGVGTIIGAIAVIVAAAIGGNTFKAWRRQQLLQKRMAIAEMILTTTFKVDLALKDARRGYVVKGEIDDALDDLVQNQIEISNVPPPVSKQRIMSAVYRRRIQKHSTVWNTLEECRASAYAYFGKALCDDLTNLSSQVTQFVECATAYADLGDDRSDSLMDVLNQSHRANGTDNFAAETRRRIEAIESQLSPILQESQKQTSAILKTTVSFLGVAISKTI